MDIQIVIKDDLLRGVATSVLLAVVGAFFVIIVQSTREGVTLWLYDKFPRNKGKLYVMATSRGGSYFDVFGLFKLIGGWPMFIVSLAMILGTLASIFSGLIVGTKNVPMDFCTKDGCFSTGFGQNLLEDYDNFTSIAPRKLLAVSPSMRNFVLQDMNNTVTAGLPWLGSRVRRVTAANLPPEIHQIPIDRLKKRVEYTGVVDTISVTPVGMGVEYVNGTFLMLGPGTTSDTDASTMLKGTGWGIFDDTRPSVHPNVNFKFYYSSTTTAVGINLMLMSSMTDGFGNGTFLADTIKYLTANNAINYIKKTVYYGVFTSMSAVGSVDVTFRSRSEGPTQLEFSSFDNMKIVKNADLYELFNATLDNLNNNREVLVNYVKETQSAFEDLTQGASTNDEVDFTSYIATCLTMAVSQTRPIGMIKGYEQADVVTPIISINLVLLVPLLLATIAFLIPYTIIAFKLHNDDAKWLPYKLHVDPREYIINLCYSRFVVDKPRNEKEMLKILNEDHGDNGPIFGEHEEKMIV